jgi:hypothetical protein
LDLVGQQAFEEAVAIGQQFTAEGLAPVLLELLYCHHSECGQSSQHIADHLKCLALLCPAAMTASVWLEVQSTFSTVSG